MLLKHVSVAKLWGNVSDKVLRSRREVSNRDGIVSDADTGLS